MTEASSVKIKKFLAKTAIAIAMPLFAFTLLRALYFAPNDEVYISPDTAGLAQEGGEVTGRPVRLAIPKIEVDTKIQEVGITKNGNMAAPNNFVDAGWYKYGTLPGNQGSAVIAGHVDNGVGLPAVFYDLKNLEPGDEIFVTNDEDEMLRFTVTGSRIYDYNAKADDVFTDKSGKLLKLITCSGVRIPALRTRDKRLVVTAILSEEN